LAILQDRNMYPDLHVIYLGTDINLKIFTLVLNLSIGEKGENKTDSKITSFTVFKWRSNSLNFVYIGFQSTQTFSKKSFIF